MWLTKAVPAKYLSKAECGYGVEDREDDPLEEALTVLDDAISIMEEAMETIEPGLYRHFKGNYYRVLSVAGASTP